MKIIIKSVLLLTIATFFLTGCVRKSINIPYEKEKVSSNIKSNLSKVIDKNVTLFYDYSENTKKIEKRLKGSSFGVPIEMEVGKINNEVSKLFLEQYFKDVTISNVPNKDGLLSLHSEITDYEWDRSFPDVIHIDLDMKVDAYIKDKLVLSKTYKLRDYDSSVILVFGSLTLIPLIQETFHKGVLNVYETQVKEDLLKVLKENI